MVGRWGRPVPSAAAMYFLYIQSAQISVEHKIDAGKRKRNLASYGTFKQMRSAAGMNSEKAKSVRPSQLSWR